MKKKNQNQNFSSFRPIFDFELNGKRSRAEPSRAENLSAPAMARASSARTHHYCLAITFCSKSHCKFQPIMNLQTALNQNLLVEKSVRWFTRNTKVNGLGFRLFLAALKLKQVCTTFNISNKQTGHQQTETNIIVIQVS